MVPLMVVDPPLAHAWTWQPKPEHAARPDAVAPATPEAGSSFTGTPAERTLREPMRFPPDAPAALEGVAPRPAGTKELAGERSGEIPSSRIGGEGLSVLRAGPAPRAVVDGRGAPVQRKIAPLPSTARITIAMRRSGATSLARPRGAGPLPYGQPYGARARRRWAGLHAGEP